MLVMLDTTWQLVQAKRSKKRGRKGLWDSWALPLHELSRAELTVLERTNLINLIYLLVSKDSTNSQGQMMFCGAEALTKVCKTVWNKALCWSSGCTTLTA